MPGVVDLHLQSGATTRGGRRERRGRGFVSTVESCYKDMSVTLWTTAEMTDCVLLCAVEQRVEELHLDGRLQFQSYKYFSEAEIISQVEIRLDWKRGGRPLTK